MHSAEGIILDVADFRERDSRVVLYTKEFGKLSVVAKGVKRIEAKLRGNLDIFNLVGITFVEGLSFPILCGIEAKERFSRIANNHYVYASALSCARAANFIFEERERDEDFFTAFVFALDKLDAFAAKSKEKAPLNAWLLWKKFQMTLLKSQGYEGVWSNNRPTALNGSISPDAHLLLKMLDSRERRGLNLYLSRRDVLGIEELFGKIFAYLFSCRLPLWLPF